MKKIKLVLVIWNDVAGIGAWTPLEKIKDWTPPICKTVGWLMHEAAEHIILASSLDGRDSGNDFNIIPRGMIIKIVKLKEK